MNTGKWYLLILRVQDVGSSVMTVLHLGNGAFKEESIKINRGCLEFFLWVLTVTVERPAKASLSTHELGGASGCLRL